MIIHIDIPPEELLAVLDGKTVGEPVPMPEEMKMLDSRYNRLKDGLFEAAYHLPYGNDYALILGIIENADLAEEWDAYYNRRAGREAQGE